MPLGGIYCSHYVSGIAEWDASEQGTKNIGARHQAPNLTWGNNPIRGFDR